VPWQLNSLFFLTKPVEPLIKNKNDKKSIETNVSMLRFLLKGKNSYYSISRKWKQGKPSSGETPDVINKRLLPKNLVTKHTTKGGRRKSDISITLKGLLYLIEFGNVPKDKNDKFTYPAFKLNINNIKREVSHFQTKIGNYVLKNYPELAYFLMKLMVYQQKLNDIIDEWGENSPPAPLPTPDWRLLPNTHDLVPKPPEEIMLFLFGYDYPLILQSDRKVDVVAQYLCDGYEQTDISWGVVDSIRSYYEMVIKDLAKVHKMGFDDFLERYE
jgi:hypothetical protein